MSRLTLPGLTAVRGQPQIILPFLLVLNAGLGWLARDLPTPALLALVLGVTGIEAVLWLHSRGRYAATTGPASSGPRLTSLVNRSTAARRGSIRDEATGLLNRWYLDLRLEEEAARCRRYGLSMAVVVIRTESVPLAEMSSDGWQERTLAIAQKTLQVVRSTDLSARLSPSEFAICLVHCDREGAERAVARLEAQLGDLTCDTGIAVLPEDNCEADALIELARVRCVALAA